jgi:nanoRNase/pAp phosphatase (c-di-AMP/oligoRNAs hydrolase)
MNHHDVILAMRHPLVIYHGNCMDGFGAAWAAHCTFQDNAEYMPAAHGEPNTIEPLSAKVRGRDVLILDFSYKRHFLNELAAEARSLVVLDHHKTAEEDLRDFEGALFDMNRSGAGITWDTLNQDAPGRPPLIDYVEDRDLWRFRLPYTKEINAWIGCVDFNFRDYGDLAADIMARPTDVRLRGEAVLRKLDRYVNEMAKQARRVSFAGHDDIPAVNAPYINTSELVGHLAESALFAIGWFRDAGGTYRYSLRSRGDFDVSALAKRFGGGGHKNAAGFSSTDLLV